MKVIIIEDEIAPRQYLDNLLSINFNELQIVATADSVPAAVAAIAAHQPDIVFLDVELKLGTGFDVLAQTSNISFQTIFTTAFNRFAIDAFRHHAVDYLLKPLNPVHVIEATKRCIDNIEKNRNGIQLAQLLVKMQQSNESKPKMAIPSQDGIEFIEITDIIYCEAKGNYSDLWLQSGKKITASRKLKELQEMLPEHLFFRTHNSYVVNIQYVDKYHKGRGGYLVLSTGISLPISTTRKEDFLSWLR